jgi:hypothetical protein
MNGISTLDLVMIQRHILDIKSLDGAYKFVAADVNSDTKINVTDIVELRKLILGVQTKINSNTSWRFIDKNQTFNDITKPWPLVETINTGILYHEMMGQDFIGVKIGDINGSAVTHAVSKAVEPRSNTNLYLMVEDKEVVAGKTIEIPVTAKDYMNVFGYQFTLSGLDVLAVNSGAIDMKDKFAIMNDKLTVAYAAEQAQSFADGQVLFTIIAKANKNAMLSQSMFITSEITTSEFYNENLEVGKIKLEFRSEPSLATQGYALLQNEPNPFKAETKIRFNMPNAGEVKFTLTDITGRVILAKKENALKGMNTITFNRSEIPAAGVVWYTFECGDFTATKKMIILE